MWLGLSENYLNRVDEFRMRDRNDLVCLDVKINEVSQPYGWLKQAKYECLDCGTPTVINQRRARERESPRVCRVCLDKVFSDMDTKDLPMGMFHPRPNFQDGHRGMRLRGRARHQHEPNHLQQRTSPHQLLNSEPNCRDRGGRFGGRHLESSTYARINGIVRVQPVPERNFAKDTRRLLSIDILSVEELPVQDEFSDS